MQNKRTDITDYVIHFLRKQNINDLPPAFEFEGETHFPEDTDIAQMTEIECLFNIIAEGGLRGGFSFRGGKATIYGYQPTVCFTEMPLINLLEYRQSRNNPYRISDYGIAVKKRDLFNKGGRPVIYGLSPANPFKFDNSVRENKTLKIIKESILPIKEQYRYVTLQLDGEKKIDWTHEREWRITTSDDLWPEDDNYNKFYSGVSLFDKDDFEEVIFIVKNKEEALRLERYVRPRRDSGYTRSGEFTTNLQFLVLDLAVKLFAKGSIKNIEDLPDDVFYNFSYVKLSTERVEALHQILEFCKLEAKRIGEECLVSRDEIGFCGWCTIGSFKADDPTIRYLFDNDLVSVYDGCYVLNDILTLVPHSQNLNYHTYIAEKICSILNEKYENLFTFRSHDD